MLGIVFFFHFTAWPYIYPYIYLTYIYLIYMVLFVISLISNLYNESYRLNIYTYMRILSDDRHILVNMALEEA
jgi:hypothetical protein